MEFETCVLAAATADLGDEPAAREYADAVEFRMDLATRPLDALAKYDGTLPLIATNRTVEEGGEATSQKRLDVLERAAQYVSVEAIDIELAAVVDGNGARVVECAREHDTAVIVSAHDFSGTPPRAEMMETLKRAIEHGDVAKLAVTGGSLEGVLSLLSVTRELDVAGHRVATMAMGEIGRHSRVIAPLYGSKIAYAPIAPENATAPGQYDLATLSGLLDALR